nr:hypothetical protein GCM10020093_007610 [Planobispora longispora]
MARAARFTELPHNVPVEQRPTVIEQQLRHVASWLSPAGRIVMRASPGLPTGAGLEFFGWSPENVDAIGAAAGLRRDGVIRYDTCRTAGGHDEPRLVWQYQRPSRRCPPPR